MTTLQQALHIFRKDARAFRLEIAGVLILNLILILASTTTWEGLQEGNFRNDADGLLGVLLLNAWALLIARSIQAEALPGDRHFWLTRPYSRRGLLLAKVLFALAFIHIPLFISQAMIISFSGLPLTASLGGLVLNQVIFAALILLPIAAIAALTRNLAQFLPATLLVVAFIAFVIEANRIPRYASAEWVRAYFAILIAGSVAGAILWLQYRSRQTGRHAVWGGVSCLLGVILVAAFPDSVAFALQTSLVGSGASKTVTIGPPVKQLPSTVTPNRYRQLVEFPIVVTGVDPEDIALDSPRSVTFRTLAGITRRAWAEGRDFRSLRVSVDREFYEAAKNSPLRVQVQYTLTEYAKKATASVPKDGTPVWIPVLGQCGTAADYYERHFVCRAPLRGATWLDHTLDGKARVTVAPTFWLSPNPVRLHGFAFPPGERSEIAPAAPEAPLQVIVREPAGYFRDTLDVPNIKLADYAIPEPVGEGNQ